MEAFSDWIGKVEKVEALKMRGMASAGILLQYA